MDSLRGLNLNLLLALDALLAEESVSRAASRVGVSQSAMSHALRQARELLGDPLLVRAGEAMVPTPRALALRPALRRALGEVAAAIHAGEVFDPATTTQSFCLAMGDAFAFSLGPPLLARLRREAPGVDLSLRPAVAGQERAALESGEVDFLVSVDLVDWPGLRTAPLARESFVVALHRDHPAAQAPLDLATYAALPHALITPSGSGPGVVDHALMGHGLSRRIAARIPFFLVAPAVTAATDLVLTLPRSLALAFAAWLPLTLLEPPVPIPGFGILLVWHPRLDGSAPHDWLRGLLIAAAAGPEGASGA